MKREISTTTVGVDPGTRSPAHVLISADHDLLAHSWRVPFCSMNPGLPVFVEGQQPRKTSSRASLITLGRAAGVAIGAYLYQGYPVAILPVRAWRNEILPRSESLPKEILHHRLHDATPPDVRELGPDAVDAYWIARAGRSMLDRGVKIKWLTW